MKRKNFETRLFTNTSDKEEPHPTAQIPLDPDYVLIGGGAYVDWHPPKGGNLLTESYPASLYTWKVASKDHLADDPSKITAYAIGARVK